MVDPQEVELLKNRIKIGNDKLNTAWESIVAMVGVDEERWKIESERWFEAHAKLINLARLLNGKGFRNCLYIEDGKKTRHCLNPGCQACPSDVNYWEKELMDLPSGGDKSTLPPAPTQPQQKMKVE